MEITGKITGIRYQTKLIEDLKLIDFADFDINSCPTACLVTNKKWTFAISKWVSPKRTRSYIRQLFSFANIISWDLTYGMRNVTDQSNQKGKELFISNYLEKLPSQKQMDLFEMEMT